MVADHGRQGNGLDDHHAGGRREAADEDQYRQAIDARRHGQGQHEAVRILAGASEQAGHGDGDHEQIDDQQVEGKQPGGTLDVPFVDILHHQHLELTWQTEKGQEGQYQHAHPAERTARNRRQTQASVRAGVAATCLKRSAGP